MKFIFHTCISLSLIAVFACKRDSGTDVLNSTDEKLYISEEFLSDNTSATTTTTGFREVEPNTKPSNPKNAELPKGKLVSIKNYARQDDSVEEFAKASTWHAVKMVYNDEFIVQNVRILKSEENNNQLIVDLSISWTDRWVSRPYNINGTLKVNKDGSNGSFDIISKNLEAEALEFTNPKTVSSAKLPNI
jgi:hypothetical protein